MLVTPAEILVHRALVFNCHGYGEHCSRWFSVSRHPKQIKIEIKTIRQIMKVQHLGIERR